MIPILKNISTHAPMPVQVQVQVPVPVPVPVPAPVQVLAQVKTQSTGLRKRLKKMNEDGHTLIENSSKSESTLNHAMVNIIAYAKEQMALVIGASVTVIHKSTMSLYECQKYFHACGGPAPNEENKAVFMKPDGGILFAVIEGEEYPLLIVEDKVQGTNDRRNFEDQLKRQSTGNAIERGAKNIRGAEMIFSQRMVFPYAIFANGCDFHHTETIAKRIEMMNMGVPNHYIEVTPANAVANAVAAPLTIEQKVAQIVEAININKLCGKSIASVFVKAHKWDEMANGASRWQQTEIETFCYKIIDLSIANLRYNLV
jgi:hypothetical protein